MTTTSPASGKTHEVRAARSSPARRKLLERAPDQQLPRLQVTSRDADILQAVYDYRALTRPQIQQLLFPNHLGSRRGRTVQCQRRLQLLYHHGYLHRDEQPVKLSEGRQPLVYFLDRRGAEFLAQAMGVQTSELDWRPRDNVAGAGHLFLNHLLHTNDVRIAITLAAEGEGCRIERWLDDRTLKRRQMKDYVEVDNAQTAIVPDGYFQLAAGEKKSRYFLEVDLSTVTGVSRQGAYRDWRRKVQAYATYHDSGKYQTRYGAESFRVLIVTTSRRRLANLKRITEESGGGSRFWFATLADLCARSALTGPLWQVAGRADSLYSLLL